MLIESGTLRRTTPVSLTGEASCSLPLKTMKRVSGMISRVGFNRVLLLVFVRGDGAIMGVSTRDGGQLSPRLVATLAAWYGRGKEQVCGHKRGEGTFKEELSDYSTMPGT